MGASLVIDYCISGPCTGNSNYHASQTIVVYPPTGSTTYEREMSTPTTLRRSMALLYLYLLGSVGNMRQRLLRSISRTGTGGTRSTFSFSYVCHGPLVSQETASSSAECSRDKPLFSFVRGQDSTMWYIVWVSPQGHRSVSVSRHFLLQAPQCPCSVRKWFSRDHCCRGRSKPGCRIVGSHTK